MSNIANLDISRDMHFVRELITPQRATELLANKHPNRKFNQTNLQLIMRAMESGDFFSDTHQAIAINVKRQVTDGQHRLEAIRQTGRSTWLWIAYNVPEDALKYIDLHKPRTISDTIKIVKHGKIKLSRMDQAVINRYRDGILKSATGHVYSPNELLDFYELHGHYIDYAIRLMNTKFFVEDAKVKSRLTISSVVGAIARAAQHVNHVELENFARVYLIKTRITTHEIAATQFRAWLLDLPDVASFKSAALVYLRAQEAINAFINREPLPRRIWAHRDEDIYPLIIKETT